MTIRLTLDHLEKHTVDLVAKGVEVREQHMVTAVVVLVSTQKMAQIIQVAVEVVLTQN